MDPVSINAYTLSCALGTGIEELRAALRSNRGGLDPAPWQNCPVPGHFGRLRTADEALPDLEAPWRCRNNQLAALALRADGFETQVADALRAFGAARLAIVIGTSTAAIADTEAAFAALDEAGRFPPDARQGRVHNPHGTTAFVAEQLGIDGPAMTVSTACSSSARAFGTAERLLRAGLADAVVVGGVDSLCLTVIHGFNSLQLVAADACRPFDRDRTGISLGEAAGFALLTREPGAAHGGSLVLAGYGESTDAWHMSSAHPEGLGARLAMEQAVASAGLAFDAVDYLNLHGTGTTLNDEIEAGVVSDLLGRNTLLSATKGWTGHALGSAGIVEAVLVLEALATGLVPGTRNTVAPEPALLSPLLLENTCRDIAVGMSNSFGFGGNNCCLLFSRATP